MNKKTRTNAKMVICLVCSLQDTPSLLTCTMSLITLMNALVISSIHCINLSSPSLPFLIYPLTVLKMHHTRFLSRQRIALKWHLSLVLKKNCLRRHSSFFLFWRSRFRNSIHVEIDWKNTCVKCKPANENDELEVRCHECMNTHVIILDTTWRYLLIKLTATLTGQMCGTASIGIILLSEYLLFLKRR